MKFKILTAHHDTDMEKQINASIKEGWLKTEPLIVVISTTTIKYIQVMNMPSKENQ